MADFIVYVFLISVVVGLGYALWQYVKRGNNGSKQEWVLPTNSFPEKWQTFLLRRVTFYASLDEEEKTTFELKIMEFIGNCRITGIQTEINDEDKLLVAASAVIPIFRFQNWAYSNLYEVLIYPTSFNEKFETAGKNRTILGMVGTGYMQGKMVLSKQALHHGFDNESDKRNTAIHEFVHLIDMMDGNIDGIPAVLTQHQFAIPWLSLIEKKIEEIYKNKSDINPYGATSKVEFFAVISEYFFERPKLLEEKHPELYSLLGEVFNHDMAKRKLERKKFEIGRNDPCPCESGKKFKKCCGSVHF
jgi:MtfA peptidase